MPYRVAFDVTQAGFRWWPSLLIAIASALAFLWGRTQETSGEGDDDDLTGLFFKFLGIAGLIASVALLAFTYTEYRSVMQALSSGNCIVASGVVTNFTAPHGKGGSESFTLDGVQFHYGSGLTSTVFGYYWNRGFIHNGVNARITYTRWDRDILRVEIR
jgi:hypothetical protein